MATSDPMHILSLTLAKNYSADPTTNRSMINMSANPDRVALNLGDVYEKGKQAVTDFIEKNGLNKPIGQQAGKDWANQQIQQGSDRYGRRLQRSGMSEADRRALGYK